MTPEELRRLARRKEADAAALVSDADRLRVQAAVLDGSLDPLVPMSQRVWAGPAAEDFEDKVRTCAAILAAQARRLREIAGELEQQAQQERREALELRARATVVQAAASAAATVTGVV